MDRRSKGLQDCLANCRSKQKNFIMGRRCTSPEARKRKAKVLAAEGLSGDESESANALAKVCFWPILDHSGANGFIEDEKDGGCGGQPSCRTDGQGQSYDSKAPYHGSSRKGSPNNPANAQPMLRLLHPHITLPTSYGRCFVFYMLAHYRGESFFSSFSFFFPGETVMGSI